MKSVNPAIPDRRHDPARFALLCTLLLLAAVALDPFMGPLNRVTAFMAGRILAGAGFSPQVHADLVTLGSFPVRIVTECTSLYATILLTAFIVARPATWQQRLAGIVVCSSILATINLFRIAGVTAIGATYPQLFEILHVYLGQVVMLVLVVACCQGWQSWVTGEGRPYSFLFRVLCWATILFTPWLTVHKVYLALLDSVVRAGFTLVSSGYTVITPLPFRVYNHPFSVPFYAALLLASQQSIAPRRLFAYLLKGMLILACWHALFRMTHVAWTAYGLPALQPVHTAVYLVGQFLLPVLLWMRAVGTERQAVDLSMAARGIAKLCMAALTLLTLSGGAAGSAAAEPLVLVHPNGRGAFNLKADGLNRVTGADIRISYESTGPATPQVSGAGFGEGSEFEAQTDTPGAISIRFKSANPLSGQAQLATLRLNGRITFLSAWLVDEEGGGETARTAITNPPEEDEERAPKRQTTAPPAAQPASLPVSRPGEAQPVSVAPVPDTAGTSAAGNPAAPFTRRHSLFDRFLADPGGHSAATLARLLASQDDERFRQDPPLLITDGSAALRAVIAPITEDDDQTRFVIIGCRCVGLHVNEQGKWVVEVVPDKGRLAASITILASDMMVEYPLSVAPPSGEFRDGNAGEAIEKFVQAANELAGTYAAAEVGQLSHESQATDDVAVRGENGQDRPK